MVEDRKAKWNSQHGLLRSLVAKPTEWKDAQAVCLDLHAMVHESRMSRRDVVTFEDELWDELSEEAFRVMPTVQDETIAWSIWHITRIEDITMNILVANESQVINQDAWLTRMNIACCDTGNSMSDEEIISFSSAINQEELRNYRLAVGRRTREILESLQSNAVKKKIPVERLQRVLSVGAVAESAQWLIEFWGRKTVGGLLLMPATRHQFVHLNEALHLKKVITKKQKK